MLENLKPCFSRMSVTEIPRGRPALWMNEKVALLSFWADAFIRSDSKLSHLPVSAAAIFFMALFSFMVPGIKPATHC